MLNNIKIHYQYPEKVTNIIINELYNAHIGQGLDIYWKENKIIPSMENYISMIDGKTGFLFNMIINILLMNDEKYLSKFSNLFLQLSRFFQMRDDYINITSVDYWEKKGICEDFDEKKISYLIVLYKNIKDHNRVSISYNDFFSENKLSNKKKFDLYCKFYNENILTLAYDKLKEIENNTRLSELEITGKTINSDYLDNFFKLLSVNLPKSPDSIKKYFNIE